MRDAITLQAGSMAGMFAQAVAGILIARWLGPELFGAYALAFSVAAVASIFLGAGAFDALIPHVMRAWASGERTHVRPVLAFIAKFVVLAGAVSLALGLVLPAVTARAYGSAAIGWYALVILAGGAVSTTFFSFASLAAQVTGRIRTLSLLTFGDQAVRFAWVLALVAGGAGVAGAATGHLAGALTFGVVSALVWVRISRRTNDEVRMVNGEVGWPGIGAVVRGAASVPLDGYVRETLWVMADRNLAMLFGALPVALTGLFVAAHEVAYFKVAFGYITLALSVLGPVSVLLNSRFPELQAREPGRLRAYFIRVTFWSVMLSAALTAAALAVAPWLFRFLYGPEYSAAVPYAFSFGLHGVMFGLGVALGPMWRALGKVKVSILINLITLGIGVPLGVALTRAMGVGGAVAMVTGWYLFSHSVSFTYLVRALGKR